MASKFYPRVFTAWQWCGERDPANVKSSFSARVLIAARNGFWWRPQREKSDLGSGGFNSIPEAEVTVAEKHNQGTLPKSGSIRFQVCFFGSFLHKQKRTKKLQREIDISMIFKFHPKINLLKAYHPCFFEFCFMRSFCVVPVCYYYADFCAPAAIPFLW